MAWKKNKRRKRKQTAPSAGSVPEKSGPSVGKLVVLTGLVVMAVIAIVFIWQSNQAVTAFEETAALGRPGLSSIKTERNNGSGHYEFGRPANYPVRFPSSGLHDPRWTEPGFYETPQNAGKLVHALEHGNVVIYYDNPGSETLALLKLWSTLFVGQWSGIVVAPALGLGEKIVLTTWRKKLRLKPFSEPTAAAFIDTFRGRGPEKPVR